MKVYRFMKQSSFPLWLKVGYENECHNLVNEGLISPTYADAFLGKRVLPPNAPRKNTFGAPTEMSKYFFGSLAEAIKYAKNSYNKDANYGRYFEYAIVDVDITDEILKQYVGVGFYFYCENYVEYKIPYEVLYELFAEVKDERFSVALNFYNKIKGGYCFKYLCYIIFSNYIIVIRLFHLIICVFSTLLPISV